MPQGNSQFTAQPNTQKPVDKSSLAQMVWRKAKRAYSREIDTLGATQMIDALYHKKYADVLLKCAEKTFAVDSTRFIIAVNLLELKIAGEIHCPNHKLDQYEWMPQLYHPSGMIQWILQTFVENGSEYCINLSSRARKTTLKPGSWRQQWRRLEWCRQNIAQMLVGDALGWQNQVPYIKQLWRMNKKLSGQANDNAYEKLRIAINRMMPPLPPTDRLR